MNRLFYVPTLSLPLALYLFLTPWVAPESVWLTIPTFSAYSIGLTLSGLVTIVGIICLGAEMIKATLARSLGTADQIISVCFLLLMCLLVLSGACADQVGATLLVLSFIDVVAGSVISHRVASMTFVGAGGNLPIFGGVDQ